MSTELISNRVDSQVDASRHRRKCEVCNHPEKEEIERRFYRFEETKIIASDFGILHDSIDRHVHALGLRLKRGANTEKVLEFLIARGVDKYSQGNKEMSDGLLAAAITEYDKITGKQKELAKNPNDLEAARIVLENHRRSYGLNSEQLEKVSDWDIFIIAIKPNFPNVLPEQIGVVREIEGEEPTP